MKLKKNEIISASGAITQLQGVGWKDGRVMFRLALIHKHLIPYSEAVHAEIEATSKKFMDADSELPQQFKKIISEVQEEVQGDSVEDGVTVTVEEVGDSTEETEEWKEYQAAIDKMLEAEETVDIKTRIPEDWIAGYRDDGPVPHFGAIYQLEPFITNGEVK